MVSRILTSVVWGVATSLAWTGCRPAVPPPVGNQKVRTVDEVAVRPKVGRSNADENLFRVRLLMADAVQKDLGLTTDQVKKIMDYAEFSREQSREWVAKWPDFPISNVPARTTEAGALEFQAWIKDWQSKQKELRAKVVGMLTPSQSERLEQIRLQQRISVALTQPELIEALTVSETQLARIRPLSNGIGEKRLAESRGLFSLPPQERRDKLIELRKKWDKAEAEANKLAIDVLTPEQQAKLEKLVGKHVEVTWDYDDLVPSDGVVF